MKPVAFLFAVGVVLTIAPPPPAVAGEAPLWRYDRRSPWPPFPHSGRAQSVWDSLACWDNCGSYSTWNLVACLERDTQGHCLKYTDAADRYCQRECRIRGGPLLPIDTLFPLSY